MASARAHKNGRLDHCCVLSIQAHLVYSATLLQHQLLHAQVLDHVLLAVTTVSVVESCWQEREGEVDLVVVENLGMRFCLAPDLYQTFKCVRTPYVAGFVVSVESK